MHGRLHKLVDILRPEAVKASWSRSTRAKLRDQFLGLDHQVGRRAPWRWPLASLRSSCAGQIVAIELDGHLGLDAGEHVGNQVGKRLLDARHYAWHVGHRVAQFFEDLFPASVRSWAQTGDDLRDVDPHGVFVEFRPAGLAHKRVDAVDLLEPLFPLGGDLLRLFKRGARRRMTFSCRRLRRTGIKSLSMRKAARQRRRRGDGPDENRRAIAGQTG